MLNKKRKVPKKGRKRKDAQSISTVQAWLMPVRMEGSALIAPIYLHYYMQEELKQKMIDDARDSLAKTSEHVI